MRRQHDDRQKPAEYVYGRSGLECRGSYMVLWKGTRDGNSLAKTWTCLASKKTKGGGAQNERVSQVAQPPTSSPVRLNRSLRPPRDQQVRSTPPEIPPPMVRITSCKNIGARKPSIFWLRASHLRPHAYHLEFPGARSYPRQSAPSTQREPQGYLMMYRFFIRSRSTAAAARTAVPAPRRADLSLPTLLLSQD